MTEEYCWAITQTEGHAAADQVAVCWRWLFIWTSPYRSFATTVSQLKICDFSGETFKGFEVL